LSIDELWFVNFLDWYICKVTEYEHVFNMYTYNIYNIHPCWSNSFLSTSFTNICKTINITSWHAYARTEGKRKYSCETFAISALEGRDTGKGPVSIIRGAEWGSGPNWTGTKDPKTFQIVRRRYAGYPIPAATNTFRDVNSFYKVTDNHTHTHTQNKWTFLYIMISIWLFWKFVKVFERHF
jgi:hypothetical protein